MLTYNIFQDFQLLFLGKKATGDINQCYYLWVLGSNICEISFYYKVGFNLAQDHREEIPTSSGRKKAHAYVSCN